MKNLISIYLAICLSITLSGFGQVSKDDISNYLLGKQLIKSDQIFTDNHLVDLNRTVLDNRVICYDFVYRTYPAIECIRIGIYNNKIYAIPQDFNLLLDDLNKKFFSKEQSVLALLEIMLNTGDSVEIKRDTDTSFTDVKYQYEVISWTKINGVRSHYYFSFLENRIKFIREVILDVYFGNYNLNDNILTPGKGHVNFYFLSSNFESKPPPLARACSSCP